MQTNTSLLSDSTADTALDPASSSAGADEALGPQVWALPLAASTQPAVQSHNPHGARRDQERQETGQSQGTKLHPSSPKSLSEANGQDLFGGNLLCVFWCHASWRNAVSSLPPCPPSSYPFYPLSCCPGVAAATRVFQRSVPCVLCSLHNLEKKAW